MIFVVCGLAGLAGCNRDDPPPRLVIDDPYDADNAKIDCLIHVQMHDGPRCKGDAIEEVRAFQDRIVNDIAANSGCDGIAVDVFTGTASDDEDGGQKWNLMLDFSDARKVQKWTLIGQYPDIREGNDDSEGIARQVCSTINAHTSIIGKYFP